MPAIQAAFKESPVPIPLLQEKCERVFGIKVSQLDDMQVGDIFTLIRKMGFATVYGITNSDSTQWGRRLQVEDVELLSEFMLAPTIEEAKTLFLEHAANYLSRQLNKMKSTDKQTRYQDKLPALAEQVKTLLRPYLFDGLSMKKSVRAQRICNLGKLGEAVTAMIFISLAIENGQELKILNKQRNTIQNNILQFAKEQVLVSEAEGLSKARGKETNERKYSTLKSFV